MAVQYCIVYIHNWISPVMDIYVFSFYSQEPHVTTLYSSFPNCRIIFLRWILKSNRAGSRIMPFLQLDSSCQIVFRFAGRPGGSCLVLAWDCRNWDGEESSLTGDLAHLGLSSVGWQIPSPFPFASLLFLNMEAELRTASPSILQGSQSLGIVVPGLRRARKEGRRLWGHAGKCSPASVGSGGGHCVRAPG